MVYTKPEPIHKRYRNQPGAIIGPILGRVHKIVLAFERADSARSPACPYERMYERLCEARAASQ